MEPVTFESARSGLWDFPGEAFFEHIAWNRFGLSPAREAAGFRHARPQPVTELLTARDPVLGAYRTLMKKVFTSWVPDAELGVETGAGAGFFYTKIIQGDPDLARQFGDHWIQFEVNEQLVDMMRHNNPEADIRCGDLYRLQLRAEEQRRRKVALANSSYDGLTFPRRAARNQYALLNPGECFLLVQDVLPGGESILQSEQVRKHSEGDISPVEYVTKTRPNRESEVVKIKYRGLMVPTTDYYHTRICDALETVGFVILAEGYASQTWMGAKRSRHEITPPGSGSRKWNYFHYDMGSRTYGYRNTIPNGLVKEELRMQVIVSQKQ
ncbi:MAG TPA: hypothetical protein VKA68_00305 [bacterium]|nr:hypothetical protein [bacterium]